MQTDPIKRIKKRFELNIRRVTNLLAVYSVGLAKQKIDRSKKEDILRSAVVLLHATLEDLLRELLRWKSPLDDKKFVSKLALGPKKRGAKPQEQFTISDLLNHREETVEQIIQISINAHLDKRTFNHIEDVIEAIKLLGLEKEKYEKFFSKLAASIARRHEIVHRSDRTAHSEQTHGKPTTIDLEMVADWAKATSRLGSGLLNQLADLAAPSEPKKLK